MRPQRQPVQHQRLYPCRPVRHPRGAHRDRDRDQSPGVRATPDILSGEIYTKAIFCTERPRKRALFLLLFWPSPAPAGHLPPHAWEASVPASVFGKVCGKAKLKKLRLTTKFSFAHGRTLGSPSGRAGETPARAARLRGEASHACGGGAAAGGGEGQKKKGPKTA